MGSPHGSLHQTMKAMIDLVTFKCQNFDLIH